VAFGSYDPIVTHAAAGVNLNNGAGKVRVTCTKKASGVTLELGNGNNFSGGARRMSDGTDFLAYELYQPPSAVPGTACTFPGTTVWNATNKLNPAASAFDGTLKDFFVCGTIFKGQNVEVGAYSDVVVATVNF
jgi:spore coat protein U domain-containing protein, fimbrial subunit CupE1/2/3/6